MKVIDTVKAIIASKDINLSLIYDGSMSISRRGRRVVNRQNLGPLIALKIELKEVIAPIGPIVAPKNVKIIVKSH